MIKKILLITIILFILIQFFRIDKTNPVIIPENDFIEIYNPPTEIEKMLKTSCYDCHSSESKYPWYADVAPVSWFVKDHINFGRKYFNFSEWSTMTEKKQKHIIEECSEWVEGNGMPLSSYLYMHEEAILSKSQKIELVNYFKSLE